MARKKTLSAKIQDWLGWIKAAGISSALFGGVVLTQNPEFFPFSVGLVAVGIFLIALDLNFEKFFQKMRIVFRIAGNVVFVAVFAAFLLLVVFVRSPLDSKAFPNTAEYPPGTTLAGIPWRPEYTELQVWFTNSSEHSYDDLNILIRPMSPVAAIGQESTVPDVTFSDAEPLKSYVVDQNDKENTSTMIPMKLLATDGGYRLHCGHLPAKTTIQVVLALAEIKWVDPPDSLMKLPVEIRMRDPSRVLRWKSDNFVTHWEGNPDGGVYLHRPTGSGWVKIEGTFIGAQRVRHISRNISW
jgi:hypothetical protein